MGGEKIEDLKLMLGLVQEKVWDNEEKIKRCMECNLKNETEVKEIKARIKMFQDKLKKLCKNLTQLLLKGGAK